MARRRIDIVILIYDSNQDSRPHMIIYLNRWRTTQPTKFEKHLDDIRTRDYNSSFYDSVMVKIFEDDKPIKYYYPR